MISRSAVIDVLKETGIIQDNDLGHLVVEEINRIPTAYNVEKVEKELTKEMNIANYGQHNVKGGAIAHGKYMAYKNSIDIVKRGVVDEQT